MTCISLGTYNSSNEGIDKTSVCLYNDVSWGMDI